MKSIGNVRVEFIRGAVRLSRHVKVTEVLDCILTLDEARKLAHILLGVKDADDDLL